MIPTFSIGDLLKVLDQWKDWTRIKTCPDKLDELERRVAALETKPAAETCPSCFTGFLRVEGSRNVWENGVPKPRRHYVCSSEDCGFDEWRTMG